MPLIFLAIYSYWWKSALKPKEPSVIVLMPEDGAPELAVRVVLFAAHVAALLGAHSARRSCHFFVVCHTGGSATLSVTDAWLKPSR